MVQGWIQEFLMVKETMSNWSYNVHRWVKGRHGQLAKELLTRNALDASPHDKARTLFLFVFLFGFYI